MNKWDKPASTDSINQTISELAKNGIKGLVVDSLAEAKAAVLQLLPEGVEVHTNTSVTLDQSGITQEINQSDKFNPTKPRLMKMNRATENSQMQKLGAAPDWVVGSVHAVTEDGKVVIASNTGSNLPSYAYGSQHVIWVVGSQKIVKNLDQAFNRIYEYTLPLESERAHQAYGVSGSNVRKLLIFNSEGTPDRITIIIIKQPVGF